MKIQFTYYNHTDKHISLYRGSINDYVGYFEPGSMVSFEVELKEGQAIFLKQWADHILLVMPIDIQRGDIDKPRIVPPPLPKSYVDVGSKRIEPIGNIYGEEP